MPASASVPADETLDYAERWFRDGLAVIRPAFSAVQTTVDMTHATRWLEELRCEGVHATATHLLVYATARALFSNGKLHQIVAGNKRHYPEHVDIGLSITGESFIAPVLVIERAEEKSVADIVREVSARAPEVRKADQQMQRMLRRWGRLVPFGFLRRALLRFLFASAKFRRKGVGTFQVSAVPADWAISSAFSTAGVLMAGQTRSRVVAVDGRPEVRPTLTLTLCGDHGVWDGRASVRVLAAVKAELEGQVGQTKRVERREAPRP
jgi:pyruvate/2-oxoglutarate dehydrogenase complex dihydrolipoamide acyltransferase (E2) component